MNRAAHFFLATVLGPVAVVTAGCGSGDQPATLPKGPATETSTPTTDDRPGADRTADASGNAVPAGPRNAATPAGGRELLPEKEAGPPAQFVRQESVQEKFDDGTVRVIRHVNVYSDDSVVNDGKYVENYPSGKKFVTGMYRNGVQVGPWKYWHENGQVAKVGSYKDGRPDGKWRLFREDGTKDAVESFRDGRPDGTWTYFDETGEKKVRQKEFQDGRAEGTWSSWFPDGKKRNEQHYHAGKLDGTTTQWHNNGKIAYQAVFKAGKRNGVVTVWDKDGKKIKEVEYRDDVRVDEGVDPKTDAAGGNAAP